MLDDLERRPAREQQPLNQSPYHRWMAPDGGVWAEFFRLSDKYLLRFRGYADFSVKGDDFGVVVYPVPNLSPGTLEHLYLNQVRPLVLSLQRELVIHASAVRINGAAIAFAGSSGAGKSTLAGSFAMSGHPFLTDDGLVLEDRGGLILAVPSHPSVRLWADSEAALNYPNAPRADAVQYSAKVRIFADDKLAFCSEPCPLQRVYFLGTRLVETVEIRPIVAADAVIEWVSHSFILDIEDRSYLTGHFQQVADLARLPIHFSLDFPRRFDHLALVREAIVNHVNEPLDL